MYFLDDIKEAAGKIQDYTKGMSYEQFLADRRTQDAVIRNFEVIGEAIMNLPDYVSPQPGSCVGIEGCGGSGVHPAPSFSLPVPRV